MVDFKESYTLANAVQNWLITGFLALILLGFLLGLFVAAYTVYHDILKK